MNLFRVVALVRLPVIYLKHFYPSSSPVLVSLPAHIRTHGLGMNLCWMEMLKK